MYVSKIEPRGDIDVSVFNRSVTRIVIHWIANQVKCINGSYDFFLGPKRMPSSRYFNEDGIHRSYSRTKRPLDAWDRHVNILHNFSVCTFQSTKYQKKDFQIGRQFS